MYRSCQWRNHYFRGNVAPTYHYRPQTYAKVMFLQVSVCPQGGGGVRGSGGCGWWWGAGGHAWQGVCMAWEHVWHACPSLCRYYEIWSMSGWYASYWNAFLFDNIFTENVIMRMKMNLNRGTSQVPPPPKTKNESVVPDEVSVQLIA